MLPLYLHVNQKSNDDDDDVREDLNEIRSLFSSRVTRTLDTLGNFSSFYKGDNFCDLSTFLHTMAQLSKASLA